MNAIVDRNRIYLVLIYFSLSFFYLAMVLDEEQDPVPLLGYILGLIVLIITSHDTLLRVITQATGQFNSGSELKYFSAFVDLNRKIHNFMEADAVLALVDDTLRERIKVRNAVYLLGKDIPSASVALSPEGAGLTLRPWSNSQVWTFLTPAFEGEVVRRARVMSMQDAPPAVQLAFAETGTSLLVPMVQKDKLLCVLLLGSSDNTRPYTIFEYQMFDYLANQLTIILDRIRVYTRVMEKTAMDHAEKVQVMQSLSANIAHEMRTPLSGIRASITGIEEYLPQLLASHESCVRQQPDQFPPIRENHLNTLLGTPRRIKLMIDQANTVIDMLLMNLRENALDRRQLNPCSAAYIIEQAVDRYPFRSGERDKLYLDLAQDFSFLGIESLFTYILFNLFKNALYSLQSAQKGEITISLKHDRDHGMLIFRDTGLGIAPEIIDRIFDGFFTTKSDGTGAGLAFCRRTILSFDGDIECRSMPGEYAEFIIRLPLYHGAS